MKPFVITGLIIILFPVLLNAGGDNRPAGARSAALGNASVATCDLWSAFNNQAGLSRLENAEFGCYFENRYMMKELGYMALAFARPMKSGTIALSATYFGYSAYNESKIGLAYAKGFGKYIAFGVQLDYNIARLAESYGNHDFITFEAGMLANITPELSLGVHIYNPISAKFSSYNDERVPLNFSIGASFSLSDNITLVAETEKNIFTKATFNAGIEYRIVRNIFLRGGLSTGTSAFSFGAGFLFDDFKIDISSSYHTILGYSPQASLSYNF
ncbi:MAG: hypothetical protein V1775_16335 [Bacteroidota bacterium]